jgi:hypothetical protein
MNKEDKGIHIHLKTWKKYTEALNHKLQKPNYNEICIQHIFKAIENCLIYNL